MDVVLLVFAIRARFPLQLQYSLSCRIHEVLSEAEPAQLTSTAKTTDEEQMKEDSFSYHSAASSSWSLAGRVQQEEKQDLQEDAEVKVGNTVHTIALSRCTST